VREDGALALVRRSPHAGCCWPHRSCPPKSGVSALLAVCLLEEISAQPRNPLPCEFATVANPSPRRCQSHVAMAMHRRLGHVAVGAASAVRCTSPRQKSLQQSSRQTPPTSRSRQGAVSPPCTLSALGRYSISVIRMPDPEERHLFGRLLNQSPWPASPICPPIDQSAQHLWPAPRADNNDSSLCTSCCCLR
jgi:hypothetical protein